MKRIMVSFFIVLLMVPLLVVGGREATTLTDITIDGDVHENAPNYTRDAVSNDIYCYWNTQYRGFVEWNISSIPDAAIIDSVQVRFRSYSASYDGAMRMYEMVNQPSVQADNNAGNQVIYDDAADGDIYVTTPAGTTNTWYTVTLSAAAITDLTANLALDWFAIGTRIGSGGADSIYSSETAYDAELIVSWHLAPDYHYQVTGTYYENGTIASPSDVTVSDSFSETFSADGVTDQYYPVAPALFTWDLGSGYSRQVFVWQEENFTVFLPEDTFYPYQFTIKDYTSKDAQYLEAYRVINGTTYLIERAKIYEGNPAIINLVMGKTYLLKIVWGDYTRYTWGYFVAGSDLSITIIARGVEFTDQAQILYNDIHVEATRPTPYTTITVDYLDDLNHTTWANVTIRIRDGAIVFNQAYNNGSYTLNWAAANASLGYLVTVHGLHTDYGVWGYSKILDATPTFMDPPDLTGIFGTVSTDLIAFIISVVALLTFSRVLQAKAGMAMMFVATMLRYIGWFSISWNFVFFGWFIAIAVALTVGGSE